jgi:hypothetical protein
MNAAPTPLASRVLRRWPAVAASLGIPAEPLPDVSIESHQDSTMLVLSRVEADGVHEYTVDLGSPERAHLALGWRIELGSARLLQRQADEDVRRSWALLWALAMLCIATWAVCRVTETPEPHECMGRLDDEDCAWVLPYGEFPSPPDGRSVDSGAAR